MDSDQASLATGRGMTADKGNTSERPLSTPIVETVYGLKHELDEIMRVRDKRLGDKLDKLEERLTTNQKANSETLGKKIDDKVGGQGARIEALEKENATLKAEVKKLDTTVKEIQDTMSSIQLEQLYTFKTVNSVEQHGRRWAIRLFGLKALPQGVYELPEEAKKLVVDKLNEHLGKHMKEALKESDIDCAHRIGRVDRYKNQAMLIRFFARDRVDELVKIRRNLAGSKLVIQEDSTTWNRQLMDKLDQHGGIESSWLTRGKVFAKVKMTGKKFSLDLFDDIDKKIKMANKRDDTNRMGGRNYYTPMDRYSSSQSLPRLVKMMR